MLLNNVFQLRGYVPPNEREEYYHKQWVCKDLEGVGYGTFQDYI
jgi:hypothetical protein